MTEVRPFRSGFVVVLAAFAAAIPFFYRQEVLQRPLRSLVTVTAEATHGLIRLVGIAAERDGATISAPGGFAYEVYYRCTGFLPVLCLAVGILAYSAPGRHKLTGLLLGIPALIVLNLIRLVHLFYLGVARPELFDLAHSLIWEGVMVMAVPSLFLGYLLWCRRSEPPATPVGTQIARAIPCVICLETQEGASCEQ